MSRTSWRVVVGSSPVVVTKSMVKKFKHRFYIKNCLFGSLKLTKNADPDKYKYSGYSHTATVRHRISRSDFSFTDGSMVENVIIFGADMSSSMHIDNKNKDILILGEGSTQGLDDTTLTAEGKYPIFHNQEKDLFKVYTIMEAAVFYSLMLQKLAGLTHFSPVSHFYTP